MKERGKLRINAAPFLLIAIIFFPPLLQAAGRTEESDFEKVETSGNWEHEIDVSDREPGLYNILVRIRDKAGNEALGGPYNIFVDPESGLPEVTVLYPGPGQSASRELFVVGTAQDNEGVAAVEVRINEGSFVRAAGAAFWSVPMPLANLEDGPHTVTVRALDINGNTGLESSVPFIVDTKAPAISLTSHESGLFVTGRTKVEGSVSDANGIASLNLITEEGSQALSFRGRGPEKSFSFLINPRELSQGPHVWQLESTDLTGQVAILPFLFFVDTEPPEISILFPGEEDRTDAQLRFIGKVTDEVGVASLHYELSTGNEGEIPLTPGDPYWTFSIDLPPSAKGTITANFIASDPAGNEQRERLRLRIDQEGDRPALLLGEPADGSAVRKAVLTGHILDDDGGSRIVYTINGGPEVPVPADTGFTVPLNLDPGQYDLRVYAEDKHGLSGREVRTRFRLVSPLPQIRIEKVVRGEKDESYSPGFVLQDRESASITGQLAGVSTGRVAYRIGSSSGTAALSPDGSFSIPLPRSSEAAAVPIEVLYENEGRESVRQPGFYIQLPPQGEDVEITGEQILSRGIYLTGSEDTPGDAEPEIYLPVASSIQLFAAGGAPSDVLVLGDADFLTAEVRGQTVLVTPTGPGTAASVRIRASIGGRIVESTPFSVRTSNALPEINGLSGLVSSWLSSAPDISINVNDPLGIRNVEYRIIPLPEPVDEIGWTTGEAADGAAFTGRPTLPGEDGPALLQVRADNRAALSSTVSIPVMIDRAPPEFRRVTPPEDEVVNGRITFSGHLERPSALGQVLVFDPSGEQEEGIELPVDSLLSFSTRVTEEENRVVFKLVSRSGIEEEFPAAVIVDEEADKPQLILQVPEDQAAVNGTLRFSGVLLDDDAPASITYAVNGSEPQMVPTDGLFDIEVPLTGFNDGEHSIEVIGYDSEGVASDPEVRTVHLSKTRPESTLMYPEIDTFQQGIVVLQGQSRDPNGIAYVSISFDSGASFHEVTGTEEWSYEFDTSLLSNGTHSLLIHARDMAGDDSLLATIINIDNSAPFLEISAPADGSHISGELFIDGRVEDPSLYQVRIFSQPLDQSTGETELALFERAGPFGFTFDNKKFDPGWYNVRMEAEDLAGNISHVSRNVRMNGESALVPKILLPSPGETLNNSFDVIVQSPAEYGTLTLLANERPLSLIDIDVRGRGSFRIEPGQLPDGPVLLALRTETGANSPILSEPRTISYSRLGPWLTADNPEFLDYVRDRPLVTGRAGYEVEVPESNDKMNERERKRFIQDYRVLYVEASTNNGETWTRARGTDEWQYRIETAELADGRLNLVLRAHYANGESITRRHSVVIDEQPPTVRLLEPRERDRFSNMLRVVGVTADENGIQDIAVALRQGNKSRYEVPSFIQGLYLDFHAYGATYFDIGAGLTFFDNNVKLQAQVGLAPPGRFSGLVLGSKLLANVASIPASYFFGPDLDWLSAALAVGANFSYFTMQDDEIAFTSDGLVLAGMLAQLEFPIVRVPEFNILNTYAFYSEAQLWFISSDVEAGTAFRLSFGMRVNIF